MHVLVTRPEPGAGRTAERLRERGHEPLIMPLTQTIAITENRALLRDLRATAFVLTSAAAVRHWPTRDLTDGQKSIPVYVVGEATGDEARAAGFSDLRVGGHDAAYLAKKILKDVASGRLNVTRSEPVVYVTGRVRRPQLETVLGTQNLPLRTIEIYDTQEISYSTDFMIEQFSQEKSIAVILYSPEGARLLMKHFKRHSSDIILKRCTFFCLSPQVASAIPNEFKSKTRIAATPTEPALLPLLDQPSAES